MSSNPTNRLIGCENDKKEDNICLCINTCFYYVRILYNNVQLFLEYVWKPETETDTEKETETEPENA